MATLKAIRKRIASTGSTKKLTYAMKMIAASHMRKSQQRVISARVFNKENARILRELIKRAVNTKIPLLNEHEQKTGAVDLFVITSDRGLCGIFNENLLKRTLKFMDEEKEEGINFNLYVFGRKGRDFFRKNNIKIEKACETINDEISLCIDRYLKNEIDGAYITFNRFKNVGSSELSIQRLLPASPPEVQPEYCVDYIYEPNQPAVLDHVINNMIKSNFMLAHLESTAAELSARMVAMDKATKNAEDLIAKLTQQYNKARQASITNELIDIVGGAEALK